MTNIYTTVIIRLEMKTPLEIPRQMFEDNIRMDLREIGWEDVDWMHLAQNRDQRRAVVNTVMSRRVP
jgi:hypothetical protein